MLMCCRCFYYQLSFNVFLCFPTFLSNSQMPTENSRRKSIQGNSTSTLLAHSSLVATTVEDVDCYTSCSSKALRPANTTSLCGKVTSSEEKANYAGMSPVWHSIQNKGVSQAAGRLIMDSWRKGTAKQYSTYITKWTNFCNQREIDHTCPAVAFVLDFLTDLYHQGFTYSAINTARSALSSYVILEDGTYIGKHPLVCRLMKGIFQNKPPKPKYTEIWDVSTVLVYLQSLSPVDKLSLKQLTLKLVMLILLVSGQRGQTVLLLNIDHMSFSNDCYTFQIVEHLKQSRPGVRNPLVKLAAFVDQSLCVVSTLNEYLERTQKLRDSEKQLFISFQKPFKKVSKDTLSRWTKQVMKDAGIDTTRFKPHSTRAASTSAASNLSASLDDILKTAGWSSHSTFAKFYNKPIIKSNNFADRVLKSVDT